MTGTLKGYDPLMNLVLDDVKELMRGMVTTLHNDLYLLRYSYYHRALPLVNIAPFFETRAHECADDEGNESSRPLGLIVARGTLLVLVSPLDGSEQIENPFTVAED